MSLREIAKETVETSDLKEELIRSHQRMVAYEEDDDEIDLMDGEKEWGSIAGQNEEAEGMYSDEDVDDDAEDDEPSLEDLAGGKPQS